MRHRRRSPGPAILPTGAANHLADTASITTHVRAEPRRLPVVVRCRLQRSVSRFVELYLKMDFAIVACTPLVWSTAWVTCRSAAREHKTYASSRDKPFLGDEKLDHFAGCEPRGFVEILVESHADVVRGGLRTRPAQPLPFANAHLECAPKRRLKGGAGHFAVTLHAVAVAD